MPRSVGRATADQVERVLVALRKMPERTLHTLVIKPLLEAMGARYVRYVHGAFERGKDFVYVAADFFGRDELVACQVKSEPLSGSFASTTSTATFLQQAIHCTRTKVLNPVSNQKELPHRVVLITTYPLPDHALADAEPLLDEVRSKCTIIAPEDLVHLLKDRNEQLFNEFAYPGKGLFLAIRRYVTAHREAAAFDLPESAEVGDFFINIGMTQSDSVVAELISGRLRAARILTTTVERDVFRSLRAIYARIADEIGGVQVIERAGPLASAQGNAGKPPTDGRLGDHVSVAVTLGTFIEGVKMRVRDYRESIRGADITNARHAMAHAINFLRDAEDFAAAVRNHFGDRLVSRARETDSVWKDILSLGKIDPVALLETRDDVCISGEAGAGKTCFARMLCQRAIDAGLRCVYFPASRIRPGSDSVAPEIESFLLSLGQDHVRQSVRSILDKADLLIIDGCDESPTFPNELARGVERICANRTQSIAVASDCHSAPVVPADLSRAVRCSGRGKRRKLVIRGTISDSDYARLIACNAGTRFETVFQDLAGRAARMAPRLIITTRGGPRMSLPRSFQFLELRPFDDEQLNDFFKKRCDNAGVDYAVVMAFLAQNPHIKEVCRTPMNATIVAALYENNYDLPRSRVELYNKRFELLLDRWDRIRHVTQRTRINKSDKLQFLSRLALVLHMKHSRLFSAGEAQSVWKQGCGQHYRDCAFGDVLAELQHCNGVILPADEDHLSLGHLSYQEYLAAYAIVLGQRSDLLIERFFDPWWRQTLVFYAGISGDIGRFLERLQLRGHLVDRDGLVDEMIAEARYTGPLVREVISGLRETGGLDGMEGFEEDDVDAEDQDVLDVLPDDWDRVPQDDGQRGDGRRLSDVAEHNPPPFQKMVFAEGIWQSSWNSRLLGTWLVHVDAGREGPSELQKRAFLEIASNEEPVRAVLERSLHGYYTKNRRKIASEFEEAFGEKPSAETLPSIRRRSDIWELVANNVLVIPPQDQSEEGRVVEFCFDPRWNEDGCLRLQVQALSVTQISTQFGDD